jgi:hypothetical protein
VIRVDSSEGVIINHSDIGGNGSKVPGFGCGPDGLPINCGVSPNGFGTQFEWLPNSGVFFDTVSFGGFGAAEFGVDSSSKHFCNCGKRDFRAERNAYLVVVITGFTSFLLSSDPGDASWQFSSDHPGAEFIGVGDRENPKDSLSSCHCSVIKNKKG